MSERLRKYEFFKLCLRLRTQGFTGTVLLERADGNSAIRFEDGAPFHASSEDVTLSFAGLLIRRSLLDPSTLKRLLEESLEQHVKLETLLVDQGRLTSKEVLKTKRELSAQVFLHAYCVDDVPIRQIPGETTDEEALAARSELEVYETLFRAVMGDPDRNVFLRLFRDRWDEVLEKTADFYRHMLRFRSVAYGEDVVGHLMEGEPTARRVLGLVSDKDGALAKMFALTYSGMLMFHGTPKGESLPRPFSADPYQPSEPVRAAPSGPSRSQPPVTTELHALAKAAARRGPREEYDAAYGRASVHQDGKVAVTEDRLSAEAVRAEIIRQAENLGVSQQEILEALGPVRTKEEVHHEAPMAGAPGQETLVGLVDALKEAGVPLEAQPAVEATHRALPMVTGTYERPAEADEVVVDAVEDSRELGSFEEGQVVEAEPEAVEAEAQVIDSVTPMEVEAELPLEVGVKVEIEVAVEEISEVVLPGGAEPEMAVDLESSEAVLAALEESHSELEQVPEAEVAAVEQPSSVQEVGGVKEWVVPLEDVLERSASSGTMGYENPEVTGAQAPATNSPEEAAMIASLNEAWPSGLALATPPAENAASGIAAAGAVRPTWVGGALQTGQSALGVRQAEPVMTQAAAQPVETPPSTEGAQPLQGMDSTPDINRLIDQAMAQAALAVSSSSIGALQPTGPASAIPEEPLALEVDPGTGEGFEKSGESEEDELALAALMGGLPPVPAKPDAPELGTDESIERILEDVYRSMQQRNLYELLNVTPLSPLSAVRDATQRLRNKYAPTQYRGFLMSKRAHKLLKLVRETVDRAEQVLTHVKSRRHYDEMLSTPYPMDRQVWLHQLFHAERDFQAGLKLLTAKEFTRCVEMLGRAVTSNGTDPDYVAWRGYALYQRHKSGLWDDPTAIGRVRQDYEKALALDPRHARALLFLARLEDDLDNLEASMTWYARLQKVEPGNEEAAEALERLRKSSAERRAGDPGGWLKFKGMFNKKK